MFCKCFFRLYQKKYDHVLLDVIKNKDKITKIEYDNFHRRFEICFKKPSENIRGFVIERAYTMIIYSNFNHIYFKDGGLIIIDYMKRRPSMDVIYKFIQFIEKESDYRITWLGNFKRKNLYQDFNLTEYVG